MTKLLMRLQRLSRPPNVSVPQASCVSLAGEWSVTLQKPSPPCVWALQYESNTVVVLNADHGYQL